MIDALPSKFAGVQGKGPRHRAICSVCKSKRRTLSLYEPEPNLWLVHCFKGCGVADIVRAVGLELEDLFPPRLEDDKRKPRVRRPWRASEMLDSLRHEMHIALITLTDVIEGKPVEVERARIAHDRIVATIRELANAH